MKIALDTNAYIDWKKGVRWQREIPEGNEVHPHASGECKISKTEVLKRAGSSPREWGMLQVIRRYDIICRFIPTRVGNALRLRFEDDCQPVHPHASGECWRH